MLKLGSKAPVFSLLNQDEKMISLSDYKGKWLVLYFYPKDDTSGCTVEACEFTNEFKEFEKLDAVILGCSPDSPEKHQKFIAKYKLKIDLLCDPEHHTLEAYNAWGEKSMYGKKYMGVIRSTYLINPQGDIAAMWPKVSVKGHVAEVKNKLGENQA